MWKGRNWDGVLMKWQIELEDPSKEWELHKQWFVWPHDIKVKLSPVGSD